jgi:hypothetical protein
LAEPEGEERNRIIQDRKKLDSARRGERVEQKSSLGYDDIAPDHLQKPF